LLPLLKLILLLADVLSSAYGERPGVPNLAVLLTVGASSSSQTDLQMEATVRFALHAILISEPNY
jgi:hypothetical protein